MSTGTFGQRSGRSKQIDPYAVSPSVAPSSFLTPWMIALALAIVVGVLLWTYVNNITALRNECEYRDMVEYQTIQLATLLTAHPEILPSVQKLRYFPDNSGFYTVLDYTGKILAHGDYDGDLSKPLPFHLPTENIVTVARNGGGYVRFNHKGYIYELFVYSIENSPYIVCSGLYVDVYYIQQRLKTWKRMEKTLVKSKPSASSGSGTRALTSNT